MAHVAGLSVKRKQKLKSPDNFYVILLNDNFTPMDFVTGVIVAIFNHGPQEAERIMLDVHKKGRGVAGCYSKDIALTKMNQVHAAAENNGFPLRCIVEKA
ncbi:MAG: ATP-dependent Clp protease adaptor ClpS [Spirochaetaceae bacterium]|nr:ATP-dependent Clp protease adaptor ClpS [Spirochaetaceae bacterium]